MDMLIEAGREYLEDAERAVRIAAQIAGPLALSLPTAVGLMSIVFGFTHGKDAMADWADRFGKFTSVFPVIHEDADDEDLDLLVKTANEISKAWAAARPPIKARGPALGVGRRVADARRSVRPRRGRGVHADGERLGRGVGHQREKKLKEKSR
jgi:hypothetical protein